MRGRVLGYDHVQGVGVISGDDGNRYSISKEDLGVGVRTLAAGGAVDFVAQDNRALSAFPMQQGIFIGEKSHWIAGLLALFLGVLGIHKFYLGKQNAGVIMLLCTIFGAILIIPPLLVYAVSFVEGILYLVKDQQTFYDEYVIGDRSWF